MGYKPRFWRMEAFGAEKFALGATLSSDRGAFTIR
jgi:hypothetical protein